VLVPPGPNEGVSILRRGELVRRDAPEFENFTVFRPRPQQEESVNAMLDEVVAWSGALATLRAGR
jgi:hypothetical protein